MRFFSRSCGALWHERGGNERDDTVRESLQISRALQSQANQGFTEVIVRNPETNEERVLVIPSLHSRPAETEGGSK